MNHLRWRIFPPVSAEHLTRWGVTPSLMVQLLHNRGITDPDQFEGFINADEQLLGDPFLLPQMEEAVARIKRALLDKETIAIYGDFDTDGITATVLLTQGLSELGGKVVPYIPHRLEEGYGINCAALESLFGQGVSLVVTADCGISANPEVEYARTIGLDIVVTDHHTVPAVVPAAVAAVNPKHPDSAYPCRELAGVGVAFKLIQALAKATNRELAHNKLLDLVALGTVADMASLLGENRYLVKRGLELLNSTNRVGLREMISRAGLQMGGIDTEAISYVLGPRLNAAGRLDHAIMSYELLATARPQQASELAAVLEAKNAQRQKLTVEVLSKAKESLSASERRMPLIMAGGKDYPAGVVGIVASKLAEEFYRPVVVLELGEETSRGSARSIPEFNIVAALTQCQDLLARFGGHAQAAGFTLPNANLDRFHERLLEIATTQLADVDLRPLLAIDAEVKLSSLGGRTMKLIEQLAPFGCANPAPIFLSRGVKVLECRAIGSKGDHLRLKLRDDNVTWHAIGFNLGRFSDQVTPHLDVVYNLEAEEWTGVELLRLNLLDFAPC